MLILGVDLETTGLDPENDRITEIGAALWDAEIAAPVQMMNTLVNPVRPIPAEVQAKTGITDEMVAQYGIAEDIALDALARLAERADIFCAHNGMGFDKLFLDQCYDRCPSVHPERPADWIDTLLDIPYPDTITTRNLVHLGAEHGFLNPFPHRALFDVMAMLRLLSHPDYDLNEVLRRARSPIVTVRAMVSYDDRELAKTAGFFWEPGTKRWLKRGRQVVLEEQDFPFRTIPVE